MTRLALLGLIVAALPLAAQQEPTPVFEVASIKRNASGIGAPIGMRTLPDGQVIATNMPLRPLLSRGWGAYSTEEGLPSWMTTERYDVAVKPPAGATTEELRQMWRNLFATRMKLSARLTPREAPAYALVVARTDGRLGPQLRPAAIDCGQAGQPQPGPGVDVWAGAEKRCDVTSGSGRMVSGSALLDQFADMLFAWAGRPVINATKLTGRFAIDLRFSIPAQGAEPAGGTPGAPEIFTALQEQLGLRLEPSRTQVNVLVIDHIERPTEN